MFRFILIGMMLYGQTVTAKPRLHTPAAVRSTIKDENHLPLQMTEDFDPAFSQLDFFIGWWQCHGYWGGSRQEKVQYWLLHAEKTKLVGWLQLTTYGPSDVALESKKQSLAMISRIDFWGYQSQSSKFLSHWFEGYGSYGMLTSLGWNGDRLDWEGEYNTPVGERLFQRWEIQKMGFKLLRDKRKILREDNWQLVHESLECKKAG